MGEKKEKGTKKQRRARGLACGRAECQNCETCKAEKAAVKVLHRNDKKPATYEDPGCKSMAPELLAKTRGDVLPVKEPSSDLESGMGEMIGIKLK